MKDYMCEICDEVLKNKPALQKHIIHRHNTSENVYYCAASASIVLELENLEQKITVVVCQIIN